MELDLTDKRGHALTRGRGVTAAQRAFNSHGVGSNPSGPSWVDGLGFRADGQNMTSAVLLTLNHQPSTIPAPVMRQRGFESHPVPLK